MADRLVGEATVVSARSVGSGVFGRSWELVLDVRPPQEPQYRVVGVRTKPPSRRIGSGGIDPGLVVPVTIDAIDASDVKVEWGAFDQTGGPAGDDAPA
ncbi:MAG: hypothetical protein ACTHN0_14195 [Aquihabitans sp.]